ncbi:hypothetical protein ILT44_23555 [Microvirga sp. BT689]|uniref:toxin TcdB middle/N-terminal domain-containing protein n=1 Tax=Microvirga arvi TaxID=2778731 RepID=UPI0019514941|nr:toxin TcdB middle/N-terminal domain-containing protein [Microvirga arvi]MBM6583182.1 hypothetical protein [Microvirga arvi]
MMYRIRSPTSRNSLLYGGKTSIAYEPSTASDNTSLPMVLQRVKAVTTDDGRGTVATTGYTYSGGLWNQAEQRFLGFRTVTATLPCNLGETACPSQVYSFRQDLAAAGEVAAVQSLSGSKTLRHVAQTWTTTGSPAALPYRSVNTRTDTTDYDDAGAARTKAVERTFDDFGNVTQSIDYGRLDVTGDERTTIRAYNAFNISLYIVNVPSYLYMYAGIGRSGQKVSEEMYYYDYSNSTVTPATKAF